MSTPSPLPIGGQLDEYRIEAVLGIGTFGITYQALDTHLDMTVAIKEFYPSALVTRNENGQVQPATASDVEHFQWCLDRFVGEGQVMARFKHPNIVRVSRYFTANGTAYIVMDFEHGRSLSSLLSANPGGLSESRVRGLFLPLLEGLAEVHRKRYLHRDIKPGNIFVREHDSPVLLDFGSAELEMGGADAEMMFFTPGYAPPEQHDAELNEGPATDLYALGATMYRCVSGKRPPPAPKRQRALETCGTDVLVPAREVGHGRFAEDLLDAIDWMLEMDVARRPRSAGAVLRTLQPAYAVSQSSTNTRQRRRAQNHKLVFAGPVGAGKTTAIGTLSDTEPVKTDNRATDMARELKDTTTVVMDYGVMTLSDDERLHLYGTPGQERFDFMWDILRKGALGLVLLIDNSRRDPFKDLDFFLSAFREFIRETRLAVGITRMDQCPFPSIGEYYGHLRDLGNVPGIACPPVFSVDARERDDVSTLVQALLHSIDPGVDDYRI